MSNSFNKLLIALAFFDSTLIIFVLFDYTVVRGVLTSYNFERCNICHSRGIKIGLQIVCSFRHLQSFEASGHFLKEMRKTTNFIFLPNQSYFSPRQFGGGPWTTTPSCTPTSSPSCSTPSTTSPSPAPSTQPLSSPTKGATLQKSSSFERIPFLTFIFFKFFLEMIDDNIHLQNTEQLMIQLNERSFSAPCVPVRVFNQDNLLSTEKCLKTEKS